MQLVYQNIEKYNPDRKCKVSKVFDDKIAHVISNKTHNQIVTQLFIKGRKLNISTFFITQPYLQYQKMLD